MAPAEVPHFAELGEPRFNIIAHGLIKSTQILEAVQQIKSPPMWRTHTKHTHNTVLVPTSLFHREMLNKASHPGLVPGGPSLVLSSTMFNQRYSHNNSKCKAHQTKTALLTQKEQEADTESGA